MISNSEPSANFSDVAIRRFLLGQLNDPEQSAFERTLIADDDLESRVRLEEAALADDYARGRLTWSEERQFHERFPLTTERRQTVEVSEVLTHRFNPVSSETSSIQTLKSFFDLSRPAWSYAFAVLILLLVFATVWRKIKEPIVVGPVAPKHVVAPKPSATQSPTVAHHPTTSTIPTHVEESTTPPEHQIAAPVVVLDGSNSVGNPFELKLRGSGVDSLRVQIALEKDYSTTSYRAELWDSNGKPLLIIDAVAWRDGQVIFDVPSRKLSAGEYLIRLSPVDDSASAESQTYYFRIIR